MTPEILQHFQPVHIRRFKCPSRRNMADSYLYRNLHITKHGDVNFYRIEEYPNILPGSLKAAANAIDIFINRTIPILA